ncbi:hypothetical protein HOLleu_41609 [Holothuria leucospilota]|uniref:Apple domain-containing protein n=1 Tax=Holothuria leucospilota TaxID=206669 RepID=A0A9Q0YG57_HOLLE|nr:hypothetical protein HOLleu_41609 [Holothuria leucospilota]
MRRGVNTNPLSWFVIITVLSACHVENVLPLSCYTCSDTQTPSTSCLGSITCGNDEVCMNTIRDENGLHRVSKECKQTAACNNQQSQNGNECHPETSPSVCYYCCNTDLCNAQEIPGTTGVTTMATTTDSTTNVATTIAATTISTTVATTEGATTPKHVTSTISESTQKATTPIIPTTSTTELQVATTTGPFGMTTNLETSKMTTKQTTQDAPTSTIYQGVTTQPDGFVSCFTCMDTQTPSTDCLGSMTCGFDEVCMNTIRDENGLHKVSKECKQTAACNNQQSQNGNQCHPETSPSVCYYCCNTDLCNAQEIPGTTGVTTMATTTDSTTNVATTAAATTISTTVATTEGATTPKHVTSTISESTQKATTPIIPTTSATELQVATTTGPFGMTTNLETSKMTTKQTTQDALTSTIYQGVTTQPDGFVSCYTCTDTQTPSTDCLGSMTCGFDEVCMNTIRDENGLHKVSKECKQTAACNNQQSQNGIQCHPETSPSVCYYCCNTDLCNTQEIPGTTGVTTMATTTDSTTNVATTAAATTTSTTIATTEGATTPKHVTSTISESTQEGTTSIIPTTSTTELQGATTTLPLETSKMTTDETGVSTSMLKSGTTQSALTSNVNQGVMTQPDGIVSCYTCMDTQTPSTDCLGSMTCGFDEVCMNTIRDENFLHKVSKECKQTAACSNQQSQNGNQCHPETSPSVCYYCCNTDLCNAQEIPGTFGTTNIATTAATTNVATTTAATTIAQTTTASVTECDTTINLANGRGVTFNLIGQFSIPSEEVFMTEVTKSVIKCAMLCRSECCMKFTFDLALNHCQLSRQELSVHVAKEGSLLYNIHEYTT